MTAESITLKTLTALTPRAAHTCCRKPYAARRLTLTNGTAWSPSAISTTP